MKNVARLISAVTLASCSQLSPYPDRYTLYRNSYVDSSLRIEFATFAARGEGQNYNRNNCEMAARLLNENLDASAKTDGKERDAALGFWCEPGEFSREGAVPTISPGEFPTDA